MKLLFHFLYWKLEWRRLEGQRSSQIWESSTCDETKGRSTLQRSIQLLRDRRLFIPSVQVLSSRTYWSIGNFQFRCTQYVPINVRSKYSADIFKDTDCFVWVRRFDSSNLKPRFIAVLNRFKDFRINSFAVVVNQSSMESPTFIRLIESIPIDQISHHAFYYI